MDRSALLHPGRTATADIDASGTTAALRPAQWLRAFVGFYRPADGPATTLDPVARFLFAARSVILVISAQAAIIAGLLAATSRRFEVAPFLLVLLGFVVVHAISNLSNDYFGYRRGHDTPDSPRLRYTIHPLANGQLSTKELLVGIGVLVLVAVGIAAYFTAIRGPAALALVLAGAALLLLYDASPVPLKSIGLGEVGAFLAWGPLMIGGGSYAITGHLSATAFLVSLPYGLGVMSILVGKHIDQMAFDREHRNRTLPVLAGERNARLLNLIVVAAIYALILLFIGLGRLSPFVAVVVVALPRALNAERIMAHPRPTSPPAGYVGWPLWYHRVCLVHNRLFGWLFIIGLAVGAIFPALHF